MFKMEIFRGLALIILIVCLTYLAYTIITTMEITSGDTVAGIISMMVIIRDIMNKER